MLAPLKDSSHCVKAAGDSVHLYSFPPDALTSIVIGARAVATMEDSVRQILCTKAGFDSVAVSRAVLDLENQRVHVRYAAV